MNAMEIPRRLRTRPRFQGRPIPANTMIVDGVPDFAAIDARIAIRLSHDGRCSLCGQRIRGEIAFIASERVMGGSPRVFRDGPMHEECARYAFVSCPFVSGEHTKYRPDDVTAKKYAGVGVLTVHDPRNDNIVEMQMLITRGWTLSSLEGQPLYVAHEPARVVTRREVIGCPR